jgi:hypothetical protein
MSYSRAAANPPKVCMQLGQHLVPPVAAHADR